MRSVRNAALGPLGSSSQLSLTPTLVSLVYHTSNLLTRRETRLSPLSPLNSAHTTNCRQTKVGDSMGGNTFGVEARRLDSTQHAALFKFVQTQLDPFTPYGLRTTRSPGDKKAHGDLDVMIGSLATGPGFKYQFAGEASEYANLPSTDNNKWSAMSSTAEHPWTERELQEWMRDVARALGAVVWQKHRLGGIFAVPCHVIGHLATEAGPNEVSSPLYAIFVDSQLTMKVLPSRPEHRLTSSTRFRRVYPLLRNHSIIPQSGRQAIIALVQDPP